jgi:guanylate kinase
MDSIFVWVFYNGKKEEILNGGDAMTDFGIIFPNGEGKETLRKWQSKNHNERNEIFERRMEITKKEID